MALKHKVIEAGFAAFRLSGLHRLIAPLTRGRGVILTFHRVRPFAPPTPGYAPNRLLEIAPSSSTPRWRWFAGSDSSSSRSPRRAGGSSRAGGASRR